MSLDARSKAGTAYTPVLRLQGGVVAANGCCGKSKRAKHGKKNKTKK